MEDKEKEISLLKLQLETARITAEITPLDSMSQEDLNKTLDDMMRLRELDPLNDNITDVKKVMLENFEKIGGVLEQIRMGISSSRKRDVTARTVHHANGDVSTHHADGDVPTHHSNGDVSTHHFYPTHLASEPNAVATLFGSFPGAYDMGLANNTPDRNNNGRTATSAATTPAVATSAKKRRTKSPAQSIDNVVAETTAQCGIVLVKNYVGAHTNLNGKHGKAKLSEYDLELITTAVKCAFPVLANTQPSIKKIYNLPG